MINPEKLHTDAIFNKSKPPHLPEAIIVIMCKPDNHKQSSFISLYFQSFPLYLVMKTIYIYIYIYNFFFTLFLFYFDTNHLFSSHHNLYFTYSFVNSCSLILLFVIISIFICTNLIFKTVYEEININ